MATPESGSMVYWRVKGQFIYRFGYVTYCGSDLIRMGSWNGDVTNGPVVDPEEIEWKPYHG